MAPVRRMFMYAVLLVLAGCAAVPLFPAAFPALIAGAGGGVSYTLTNIAYRTITRPVEEVEASSLEAMRKMTMKVQEVRHKGDSVEIRAETRVHTIKISLERLTPTLTRMKVNAKRGFVFKDKTTAFELIYQTELALLGEQQPGRGSAVESPSPHDKGQPGV